MTTDELANLLCKDLVRNVGEWEGRRFIVTNFQYPNGDLVNIYLDPDRLSFFDARDGVVISDMGTTLFKCRESGVEITEPREEYVGWVCDAYGLEFDAGVLFKRMNPESAGRDCLSFCEAITRISALEYERVGKPVSDVRDRVEQLLFKRVRPVRTVDARWVDKIIDPVSSHPIDFRINGVGEARNIFAVTSDEKCTTVAAIVHFFQAHGINVPTLAVVDSRVSIGNIFRDRLEKASRVLEGMETHQEEIVSFALAGIEELVPQKK